MASVGLFRLPEAGLTPRVAPLGTADKPLPIIIDCDPGLDDALAIACAVVRPELNLLAVTSVGGNADVRHCTENALRVQQMCQLLRVQSDHSLGPLSAQLKSTAQLGSVQQRSQQQRAKQIRRGQSPSWREPLLPPRSRLSWCQLAHSRTSRCSFAHTPISHQRSRTSA